MIQLPNAVRGGLESLFRASQTFNPQNLKLSSLGRHNSLSRQLQQHLPPHICFAC